MKRNLLSLLFIVLVASAFAQTPSYVPANGLVGYWPFNGNANDESGNSYNLLPGLGATLTSDRNAIPNSAYFLSTAAQGGQLLFNSSDFDLIDGFQSGTVSFWLEINSHDITNHYFGYDNIFMTRHKSGVNSQIQIGLKGGTTQLRVHLNGGLPANDTFESSQSLELFTWYNVIYTWDNTSEKIYINGALDSSEPNNTFITELPSPDIFCFGSTLTGIGSETTNSALDDIGIWNRALTDEEILDLYSSCAITPTAIVGEVTPLNFATANYFCNDNPGSTFTWEVSNGIISSGQGTNSIVVLWGNEGAGTVSVVETNAEGCDGPTASFNVNVQCSSNISSITGNLSPVVLTSTSYTVNGPADSEYQWTVTNGVITSGQGTTSVNVIWAAEGEGTLSVIETTNTGCESPVVTITTNAVITSVLEEKQSVLSIYPNPVNDQLTIVSQQNLLGQNYQLIDAFGRVVMQGVINNSSTTLNTQALSAGVYFLVIDNVVNKIEKLN
jgi:hypothetical protein